MRDGRRTARRVHLLLDLVIVVAAAGTGALMAAAGAPEDRRRRRTRGTGFHQSGRSHRRRSASADGALGEVDQNIIIDIYMEPFRK